MRCSFQRYRFHRITTASVLALFLFFTNGNLVLCRHLDGTSALGTEDFLSCCSDHADAPAALCCSDRQTTGPPTETFNSFSTDNVISPEDPARSESLDEQTFHEHTCVDITLDSATHHTPTYLPSMDAVELAFLHDRTVMPLVPLILLPGPHRETSPPPFHVLPLLI